MKSDQDYKAIKSFLKEAQVTQEDLRNLNKEFYCYTQNKTTRIKSRKRYCQHGGQTPMEKDLPTADKAVMLDIIRQLNQTEKEAPKSE